MNEEGNRVTKHYACDNKTRPRDIVPFCRSTNAPIAEMMLSSRVVPLNVDGHHYPSKTPGRLKSRVENTIYPATVNGKAKEVSKTPFRPATLRTSV